MKKQPETFKGVTTYRIAPEPLQHASVRSLKIEEFIAGTRSLQFQVLPYIFPTPLLLSRDHVTSSGQRRLSVCQSRAKAVAFLHSSPVDHHPDPDGQMQGGTGPPNLW